MTTCIDILTVSSICGEILKYQTKFPLTQFLLKWNQNVYIYLKHLSNYYLTKKIEEK